MRDIKFRAWEGDKMITLQYRTLGELITEAEAGNWELMQFTGLKDRVGQEIYEGDVLSNGRGKRRLVVYWEPISAKFQTKKGRASQDGIHLAMATAATRCKVIGNIYENPDLLSNPKEEV